jgi:hypothetical protein
MPASHHRLVLLCVLIAAALLSFSAARAEDKPEEKKVDVTGKWKWTVTRNNQSRDTILTLKQDGEKVTGTLSGRREGQETEISDGKIKGNELSFTITRDTNNGKVTQKYAGKVDGDAIKGTIETSRDGGQSRSRDWEAKRVKEEKK